MTSRIIQFGTSRFLQAHAALFVHEARETGAQVGPITVVQTSGSPERAGRVRSFGRPEGYPVIVRGLENGAAHERRIDVRSVDGGLSANADWQELRTLFATDCAFVVSNTGDRGYEVAPQDRAPTQSDAVPRSFPGKLVALLHARWQTGRAEPLAILPCELISRNGDVLKSIVLDLSAAYDPDPAFRSWIETEVPFANTLVDRIVSEPIEPVGAVAEPYALWAIERAPNLHLPFEHPAIVLTDDLEPFERLKLHILNLGHTVLADLWLRDRRTPDETVRALLADDSVAARLDALYRDEIVPGFAAHGMGSEAARYVEVTLERLRNPFLDHRVADIAQNHAAKVERRALAFLHWIEGRPSAPEAPTLRALVAANRQPEAVS